MEDDAPFRTVDFEEDLQSRVAAPRPQKVARTNASSFAGASAVHTLHEYDNHSQRRSEDYSQESLHQEYPSGGPRKRAVTACQTCRGRRTKCDNIRPRCGYCAKVNAKCTYLEEESITACQIYGPRVLHAIEDLRQLITSQSFQSHQQLRQSRDTVSSIGLSPYDATTSPMAQLAAYHAQDSVAPLRNSSDEVVSQSSHIGWQQRPLSSQGLNSVLAWSVFKPNSETIPETWPEDDDVISDQLLSLPPPTWDVHEMATLLSRYTAGLHMKNPILDLQQVQKCMFIVAENGPDWSSRTCLIALICAIGALTESNETDAIIQMSYAGTPRSVDKSASLIASGNRRLADRFWSVAAKRLGFAIGQNTLEAVQCLCLTGIWYMNKMQPMIAWKYFSLAGNAWYSTMMSRRRLAATEDGDEIQKALRIEQSLFFTIYKSECELRVELDLPESMLENVDMTYAFPQPPRIDNYISENDLHVTERTWYYYLAEIAARHLINRVLRTKSRHRLEPPLEQVQRLLAEVDLFEAQLRDWHSSLPPVIWFSATVDTVSSDYDELTGILHMRYLTVLELLYRPFVRLCVEHKFLDEPDAVRLSVANFASRGLQCCMQKLKKLQVCAPAVHQGSWLGLRTIAVSTVILTAAHRSQCDRTLQAAADMVMPEDWQNQIRQTVAGMNRFWPESCGGVNKIKQLLDWAMADLPADAPVHK